MANSTLSSILAARQRAESAVQERGSYGTSNRDPLELVERLSAGAPAGRMAAA
ncbi:hypothetical protein ACWCQZ_43500 [Streptomyces sp. NPDC002285]